MTAPAHTSLQADGGLRLRIASVGIQLGRSLQSVLDAIPESPRGPAAIARTIGVDKVLTSRALKAARSREPLAVVYLAPGPEPLRKLLRAARKGAVAPDLIAEAEEAVGQFETLICQEAGDRSALDTIISGWLLEARSVFDLRRKQSAFRAMSQLLGTASDTTLSGVLLHPAGDGETLDVVCVMGFYGLQRLRVGSAVKFSTRRLTQADRPRVPCTLSGHPIDGVDGLRLDEFSSKPPAELNVFRVGEVLHYALAGDRLGPRSASDLVFAEVNRAELRHYLPEQPHRRRQLASDVTVPTKLLVFDALLHEDVYAGTDPELFIYDTSFDGAADVNDPARDIDRLDVYENIQYLGTGVRKFRTTEVPHYSALLDHVCSSLDWDGHRFRGYRCRVEYPIYGTQVTMAFKPRGGE
jgi:hypothetical protein